MPWGCPGARCCTRARRSAIRAHRLRREIVATSIVNNMVNLAGISFDHRMTEDSGASVSSGVYFCRFRADGFAEARKIVMLK